MEKNDISINLSVRDIKYNSIATILSLCKIVHLWLAAAVAMHNKKGGAPMPHPLYLL